jgi:hypothetical protein
LAFALTFAFTFAFTGCIGWFFTLPFAFTGGVGRLFAFTLAFCGGISRFLAFAFTLFFTSGVGGFLAVFRIARRAVLAGEIEPGTFDVLNHLLNLLGIGAAVELTECRGLGELIERFDQSCGIGSFGLGVGGFFKEFGERFRFQFPLHRGEFFGGFFRTGFLLFLRLLTQFFLGFCESFGGFLSGGFGGSIVGGLGELIARLV